MSVTASLQDLLSIEINTIKKAGMSARRPPTFPWQLMEIINSYADYLEELGISIGLVNTTDEALFGLQNTKTDTALTNKLNKLDKLDNQEKVETLQDKVLQSKDAYIKKRLTDKKTGLNDGVTNGWTTFDKLRVLAKHAYEIIDVNEEQRIMLMRIRRNCDLIKAILRNLQDTKKLEGFINVTESQLVDQLLKTQPSFDNMQLSQITTVRKIWEIGTESVLIQTVIQAEGDVITRITPSLIDNRNIAEMREALLNVHKSSTDMGLTHWKNLIGVVIDLVGQIGKSIIGK